jgi:hypothetical protein
MKTTTKHHHASLNDMCACLLVCVSVCLPACFAKFVTVICCYLVCISLVPTIDLFLDNFVDNSPTIITFVRDYSTTVVQDYSYWGNDTLQVEH